MDVALELRPKPQTLNYHPAVGLARPMASLRERFPKTPSIHVRDAVPLAPESEGGMQRGRGGFEGASGKTGVFQELRQRVHVAADAVADCDERLRNLKTSLEPFDCSLDDPGQDPGCLRLQLVEQRRVLLA